MFAPLCPLNSYLAKPLLYDVRFYAYDYKIPIVLQVH